MPDQSSADGAPSRADDPAERNRKIIETLGAMPSTPREFVLLAAQKLGAAITYRGSITVEHLHGNASPHELQRDIRIIADELKVPFKISSINDAVDRYISDQRDEAVHHLRRTFENRRDFDWASLATTCFDVSEVGVDFPVAILKHFVWQTRRKIAGLPAERHLMPVLHGPQGCGKTYFLRKFLSPLVDVTTYSDFAMIADERMIELWRSYLIVLDEMAKATKADIETVKHVITAQRLDRRPMRTNANVTVVQNATFIGASNHRLAELIKDDTGNRRFVELIYTRPKDDDYLDTVDWYSAWASVQPGDPAPILSVIELLAEQQADARHHGPVEYWLKHIGEVELDSLRRMAGRDDLVSTAELYEAFCQHRRQVTAGYDREHRSQQTFAHELNRITENSDDVPFKKARTKHRNGWRVIRPPHPSLTVVR